MKSLYLGIDASTQSMTGTVIDCVSSTVLLSESVNFERDLPDYGTSAGVCSSAENPLEVWSYPLMWLDALEVLLGRISKLVDMKKISAISGSGQQHATVWLNSRKAFSSYDISKSLSENIRPFLSREKSPVWMDASTSVECREMADRAGGEKNVLRKTGSIMTERFSGAQIRKIFKFEPAVYSATQRIHLNSSFMCSALCGADSPIDYCDGAGMNLMDIANFSWDLDMVSACAPNLCEKLPPLACPSSVAGNISQYFCEKYGFDRGAKVVVFTGDNPSSLVGLGASGDGVSAVSLGTSDTFFCSTKNFSPVENAHVFCNPNGGYMGLVCFRNGSLAREKFRELMGVDWKFFDEISFENYVPRDDGKIILPFFVDEISPKLSSDSPEFFGFSPEDSKQSRIRAFVEGQVFNIYLQAKKMGAIPKKIILTGGASKSSGIAQTLADVFGSEIYRLEACQNSAALGAAIRAASFEYEMDSLESMFCPLTKAAIPRKEYSNIYTRKLGEFEKSLLPKLKD